MTVRQEHILTLLIKEYIDRAEPISSKLLKKECHLDISPATIRNDLQDLADAGYISQPHTSAGRIPTDKAYRYFVDKIFRGHEKKQEDNFFDFIAHELEEVKQKIVKELELVRELDKYLTGMLTELNYNHLEEDKIFEILTVIGPTKITYKRNVDIIKELLEEFEDF